MMNTGMLDRNDTVLVVIDVQESFTKAIFEIDRVVSNVVIMVEAAKALGIPIVATTQNKARLGGFISEVAEALPSDEWIDKMTFSCCRVEAFRSEMEKLGRKTALVCGIETHVCVNQTVHELIALGYKVHVSADAVSSRTEFNWKTGLEKMRQSGAVVTSTETSVFELLGDAAAPEFRRLLQLVK